MDVLRTKTHSHLQLRGIAASRFGSIIVLTINMYTDIHQLLDKRLRKSILFLSYTYRT